jgi:hypothetical protein
MNCLIGGRGVGKSTVLELVRLAMGRSSDVQDTALSADLQRFLPGGDPAERWWDDSSAIEVRYTKDGRPLRILWSGYPALAGVRNLGLDVPSPDRPDLHCNFGGVGPRARRTRRSIARNRLRRQGKPPLLDGR